MNRRNFFQAAAATLLALIFGRKAQAEPTLTVSSSALTPLTARVFVADEARTTPGPFFWNCGVALTNMPFTARKLGEQFTVDAGVAQGRFEPGDYVCARVLSLDSPTPHVDNIWFRVIGTRYREDYVNGSASWLFETVDEKYAYRLIPAGTIIANFESAVEPENAWTTRPLSA